MTGEDNKTHMVPEMTSEKNGGEGEQGDVILVSLRQGQSSRFAPSHILPHISHNKLWDI